MISQSTIEQIKAAMSTFDVVNSIIPLKKVGVDMVANCPFHNEKSPSFKVSKTKNIYKCFGCGESGDGIEFLIKHKKLTYIDAIKWLGEFYHIPVADEKTEPVRVFTKPVRREGQISAKWLNWFSGRGINARTLQHFKITEVSEWMPKANASTDTICFNYFRGGELVNIKYRAENKDFKLSKDAELIFYNLDSVKPDSKTVILTEGEIDCLSVSQVWENAIPVVSVPNGAAKGKLKLEYLDACFDAFKNVARIVLMTDNDEPGIELREELARRFGYDKCLKVDYPDGCKDANDILVKFGPDKMKEVVGGAYEFPIEGVFSMDEMITDVRDFFSKGYPKGFKTEISGEFDKHLQFMLGQITIITGIPGSGKSEFVDYMNVQIAKVNGWGFGVCSFENQPSSLHVTKLMEKHAGKSFAYRHDIDYRMTAEQFDCAVDFIGEHFFFININKITVTLTGILEKAKELVLRRGIKGLIIDPWNYIEHKMEKGQTETQYISDCLTHLKAFAAVHQVHVFLIAHPAKMQKVGQAYEVPNLYSISGSAHFYNKADNGITIYRNEANNTVEVHVQKVRYSWLGERGVVVFTYNLDTRQYVPIAVAPSQKDLPPPDNPSAGIRPTYPIESKDSKIETPF